MATRKHRTLFWFLLLPLLVILGWQDQLSKKKSSPTSLISASESGYSSIIRLRARSDSLSTTCIPSGPAIRNAFTLLPDQEIELEAAIFKMVV